MHFRDDPDSFCFCQRARADLTTKVGHYGFQDLQEEVTAEKKKDVLSYTQTHVCI